MEGRLYFILFATFIRVAHHFGKSRRWGQSCRWYLSHQRSKSVLVCIWSLSFYLWNPVQTCDYFIGSFYVAMTHRLHVEIEITFYYKLLSFNFCFTLQFGYYTECSKNHIYREVIWFVNLILRHSRRHDKIFVVKSVGSHGVEKYEYGTRNFSGQVTPHLKPEWWWVGVN